MFAPLIEKYGALVLDGPMATELERRGVSLNDALWSARVLIDQPALIRDVHLHWFRAGADVAITASYQASIEGFCNFGMTPAQAEALIVLSAQCAHEARTMWLEEVKQPSGRPMPLIAGSIGSYGAFLADGSEYRGDFSADEAALATFHQPRMRVLAPHVDFFAMETLPCFREARALVALMDGFPNKSCWVCFSAADESRISSGEAMGPIAAWLDQQPCVAAVGINCSQPRFIGPLIREIRSQCSKPIVVYPNSGEVYHAPTGDWHGQDSGFARKQVLDEWYAAGMRLVGGCCRTSIKDVKNMASWRKQLKRS